MPPGDYQGQFHWHNGQGRLAIDAYSLHTADGSFNPRFTSDFAFHSLPIVLTPVLNAWNSSIIGAQPATELHAPVPRHALARPEFLTMPRPPAPPLGPAPPTFPHRTAQPTHNSTAPLIPPTFHAYPLPPISAGSPTSRSVDISNPSVAFTTPPTNIRVFFGTSPQSLAQKSHSATFGIRKPLPPPPPLTVAPGPPSRPPSYIN